MVYSSVQPWSENPNAPNITHFAYSEEKATLAGSLIGSIIYGMSERSLAVRPCIRAHFVPRDARRLILPMYGRAAQHCPSHRRRYQMGTRIPHRGHVLARDRVHRDNPPRPIHLLHRQPQFLRPQRRAISRADGVSVVHLVRPTRRYPYRRIPFEQLVG